MRLDHEFTVPAPIGEVWQAVVDPERVAPCMPGASLTKVEGDRFSGTVKVKLGPISLLYKGNGEFLEKDDAAHKVTIKASGKDSRGAGTAAATVTLTLTEAEGGTHGTVATDLSITGKPAQFGRGLISEVGGKILDTFAGCLSGKLASPEAGEASKPAAAAAPVAAAAPTAEKAPAAAPTSAQAAGKTAAAAPAPAPAPEKDSASPAKPAPAAGSPSSPATEKAPASSAAAKSAPVAKAEPAVKPAPTTAEINTEPKPAAERPALRSVPAAPETEAIDLLDYAGASVLKRLAPVVLGIAAIVGLVAIIRALRK
ncbi:SRPBCC family protein [Amycolatopsis sp. NPDC049252]|uniref:SRPBCC family protein n=1 Tax=Amycolatopsis sp. NPDC049252 TaxID=3363933 RepID=UPI00371BCECE